MIYLDTSVLGALFFREASAPDILSRLDRLRAGLATLDRRQAVAADHYGIDLFPVA